MSNTPKFPPRPGEEYEYTIRSHDLKGRSFAPTPRVFPCLDCNRGALEGLSYCDAHATLDQLILLASRYREHENDPGRDIYDRSLEDQESEMMRLALFLIERGVGDARQIAHLALYETGIMTSVAFGATALPPSLPPDAPKPGSPETES